MDQSQKVRIVLTGGGTGGHIYPLLAVAEELKTFAAEKNAPLELYYFGSPGTYSERFKALEINVRQIASAKIRRYSIFRSLFDIPKFFVSVLQAFWKLYLLMPDAVFSKGGPGAFPVVFAAWFFRIPSLIHESDATPGLTNILSSMFSYRIAVGLEGALTSFPQKKTAWVGNPVRKEILENRPDQNAAKQSLGFIPQEPLVLVVGGSQGSQRINEFIIANLGDILWLTQILHQTGALNFDDIGKLSKLALQGIAPAITTKHKYQAVPYLEDDNLRTALSAADLVISRAGAGGITEIASFGKPAIIIPIEESANGHQRLNAYDFAKGGGAVVIEENNLLPTIFMDQMKRILTTPGEIQKMSDASRAFFKPGAAKTLAKELLVLSQIEG